MSENNNVNPFQEFYTDTHYPRVYDLELDAWCSMEGGYYHTVDGPARVRILALIPRKGQGLKNIKFTIAWCHPTDYRYWNKKRANELCAARMRVYLGGSHNQGKPGRANMKSAGEINTLESLEHTAEHCIASLNGFPPWAKEFVNKVKDDISEGHRVPAECQIANFQD